MPSARAEQGKRTRELVVAVQVRLVVLGALLVDCSFNSSNWSIIAVNTIDLKLVVPFIIKLIIKV